MHKLALIVLLALLASSVVVVSAADNPPASGAPAATAADTPDQLRLELEALKKTVAALEARLAATERQAPPKTETAPAAAELSVDVKELDKRVSSTEREQSLDRIHFTGDYRFEAHTIRGNVPAHYDGMQFQNLVVKTMFATPILGRPPASVTEINNTVASHYSDYQYFANNLTFDRLKQGMASFPPAMQQQLFGMLMPSTYVPAYSDNTDSLFTNRLRLKFDAKISDNMSFTGRLSMYKVFGDSTGVQTFNGQPTSLNIDGTTTGVPNSDQIRVDRAYFSWNNIGGSKAYLSIGRRPSTGGPPLNFRQDEARGGTPSGALIDYQFDGVTAGYRFTENMVWRLCWGVGYQSGFGNANILKMPSDRLKDTHFLGANLDLFESEKTLLQFTYAHAFNVADGFNGLMVLPNNPLTGEAVGAPVVMRYTPSANLGGIHLAGLNLTRKAGPVDLYASANFSATRPNGLTTPFGGLMSDPFEVPKDHSGYMFYGGLRYNFGSDERTKVGFEFNHGSQYWFNFAQASDDIVAPKTNTRGNVFESYFTHRINSRFILKAAYIQYMYDYSGSGWHVGAPKKLDQMPMLGFPTYDQAKMFTFGLVTRF
jgi:uncharacterized protein DUF3373